MAGRRAGGRRCDEAKPCPSRRQQDFHGKQSQTTEGDEEERARRIEPIEGEEVEDALTNAEAGGGDDGDDAHDPGGSQRDEQGRDRGRRQTID